MATVIVLSAAAQQPERLLDVCGVAFGYASHPQALASLGAKDVALYQPAGPAVSVEEQLEALRADDATAALPVLIVAAQPPDPALPFDAWLPETVAAEELGRTVRALQRQYQRLDNVHAEQMQRLEAIVQHTNAMISTLSHDLKNPMSSIKGYADIMLRRANKNPGDVNQKGFQIISQQVVRMNHMIDHMHEFARLSAGRLELQTYPADLALLAQEAVDEVLLLIPNRQIELLHEPSEVLVRMDRFHMKHAINNIITNALKYSPPESVVQVMVGSKEGADAPQAFLSVRDHGIGIPEEECEQVFHEFFRASNTAKHTSGAGLGLFIANGIVRKHGGELQVSSAVQQGTTMTMLLPLAEASAFAPLFPQSQAA